MNDGKEPRGFAGLASLASDLEEEPARPQVEEIEAEEGSRTSAADTAQAEADDATAGDGAHDKDDSTEFTASSGLASEGPAEERPTTRRGQAIDSDDSRTDGPAGKPADTASPKATARPGQRPGEHAKPSKSEPPRPPQKPSSSRKWIWLVLIGAVAFYVFQETQKEDQRTKEIVRGTPEISSKPPAESRTPERKEGFSELRFSEPPVGSDNVLNVAELRWCLREDIRIETLRPQPTTNAQIDEFNTVVSDYNRRCGNFRYREGTLARARREVERHRSEIVASVSPPWESKKPQTDGGTVARGSEPAMDGRSETTLTKERVFEALRQSDPKYKDYSDDELVKWLNQAYGPDWLKVQREKLETMGREESADQEKRTIAEAPTAASGRGTAEGTPAPSSPRVTEQAPNAGEQTAARPIRSGEASQGATNPEKDPLAQASLDRDTAQHRLQEGGRGADDRVSEQVEKTEPAETTRPTNIEDGGAQPEAARVDQASDEARNSDAAHLGTGPEQTAQPEATRTQESDEDPPSSRRQLIHEIQMYLTARGYEPGPIDGLYGRRTKGAIEAFERDMGMTPTGEATIGLWRKVQRGVKPGTGPQPRGESTEATRKTGQTSRGNAGGKQGASDPTDPARRSGTNDVGQKQ